MNLYVKASGFFILAIMLKAGPAMAGPIEDLKPGQWFEVPNSKLAVLNPCPKENCIYSGNGFYTIMVAWSGGAYDTKRDRLLIWGGGHNDYGGNEIYAFSLSTMAWSRIWGPSPDIPPSTSCPCEPLADGNPSSRHTYDGLEYLPALDQFFSTGGSLWSGAGGGAKTTWVFDFSSSTWKRRSDAPTGQVTSMSAYDPNTGRVYVLLRNGSIYEYDPVKDTWGAPRGGPGAGGEYDPARTMTYHPKQKKLLVIGGGVVSLYDMAQAQPTEQVLTTTGGGAIVNAQGPGLAYDPTTDKIVGWAGGADVYSFDIPSRIWTRVQPAPTNTVIPTQAPKQGTYGRWQYVPSKNVFIGVNSVNESVWIYRMTSGNATASPPSAPINPQLK